MTTFYVGADHGGVQLKEFLVEALADRGHQVEDLGPFATDSVDYPEYAIKVATRVAADDGSRGLLVCGTGLGMSMTANKIRGIRAALVTDPFMAAMAVEHNDANVLCLGERVIGIGLAASILDAFLGAKFGGDRHARRIGKMMGAEEL